LFKTRFLKNNSKYKTYSCNIENNDKVKPSTFGMAGELKLGLAFFNHYFVVKRSIKFLY